MDEDISEAAVEEFETAFSYVPCKLWFKQLILKALHTAPQILRLILAKYKTLEVCRYTVRNNWSGQMSMQYVPSDLWDQVYDDTVII